MITCKQATKYISMMEERKLTARQRFGLWLHLGICGFCKLFMKQNKIITTSATHIHEHADESLSAAEKELMINAIQQLP